MKKNDPIIKIPVNNSSLKGADSDYVIQGGELSLTNLGQMELLCGMAERGVPFRTKVRGFSMHPFIIDSDILTISPLNDKEVALGDVIAFIQPNNEKLAIHRIIAKNESGWLVKGDNCSDTDGIIHTKNIIGRVTRIERKDHKILFGLGIERFLIAILNRGNGLMYIRKIWYLPRRAAGLVMRFTQSWAIYRLLGRRFALRIEIFIADAHDLETVDRKMNPFEMISSQPQDQNVTNWVAKRGERIVGFIQLICHSEDQSTWPGFWLFSLHVWGPYRGLGIGEKLVGQALREAKVKGVYKLNLAVFENDRRAIALYTKLGFNPVTLPDLETFFIEEKEKHGRRRIVMQKILR